MSTLRSITTTTPRIVSRSVGPRMGVPALRQLHQDQGNNRIAPGVDGLASGSAKGRTGGGERLASSSKNAPPKPKITNQSVPGFDATDRLTKEQQREVEKHNKDFEAKHDHGHKAAGDKVDKKFWSGGSGAAGGQQVST